MATIPAHVKTARKQGALAGVEQLHETLDRNTNGGTNGLSAAQEMLATIRKVGGYKKRTGEFSKPDKAVAWYCNHFNEKFNTGNLPAVKQAASRGTTRRAAAPASQEVTTDSQVDALAALLAERLGIEIPEQDDEGDIEDEDSTPATTRRVRRTNEAAEPEATATYPPPRDPDAEATQGKLWKINHDGPANGIFLVVINEDGDILAGGDDPLTAGECYDLIGEHIA